MKNFIISILISLGLLSPTVGSLSVFTTSQGGTATSTAPSYGQVLLGNHLNGYDLVATSSLGISSGSGSGDVGSGTTGQFPYYSADGTSVTATSSIFATTAGRIGIGTTTPNNLLGVLNLIDFNNTGLNTKIGYMAGKNTISGANFNTFLGYEAGLSSSTASTNAADRNTGIGAKSLYSNTTGSDNFANGYQSLYANTTGSGNVAIGTYSLIGNIGGSNNVGLGMNSLSVNTSGSSNIAIGNGSMLVNTTGENNTGIGAYSLSTNETGSGNVAIGNYAGSYETGSNAFYVDNQDRTSSANDKANALLYGQFASSASNQNLTVNAHLNVTGTTTLGNASTTLFTNTGGAWLATTGGNVGIGTTTPSSPLHVVWSGGDTLNPMVIDASASTLDAKAVFGVRTPTSGAQKAFMLWNANDSIAFAAFSNTVGGTGLAGFELGAGGSTARDVNLFRNAANVLRTNDTLIVDGSVGIGTTSPNSLFHANAGASATTTVEFGDQYSASSKACFNIKNNTGQAISFYFVGTAMIVENNRCK